MRVLTDTGSTPGRDAVPGPVAVEAAPPEPAAVACRTIPCTSGTAAETPAHCRRADLTGAEIAMLLDGSVHIWTRGCTADGDALGWCCRVEARTGS